jgi:SET domain-containing protein
MRLRRISARRSSVHGKGLFALQPMAAGERLIEYKGEVTTSRRAAARSDPKPVTPSCSGCLTGV